jgi:hypothetical protein
MSEPTVYHSITAVLDAIDARFAADRIALAADLRSQGADWATIAPVAAAQATRQAEDWVRAQRGIEACLVRVRDVLAGRH